MMPSVFSFHNVYRAYLDCRKNKRNRPDALAFEIDAEANVMELARELEDRTYHPSSATCFVSNRPKLREIFAARFRDRIVHHLLVRYLEPVWEPKFIFDSYASRRGKGIHLAVDRLEGFLLKATGNRTRRAWYLKLDIRSFFMSIHRLRLLEIVLGRCSDPDLRWLASVLILHDPTRGCRLLSPRALLERIPAHKSLRKTEKGRGLPIGNLTSQFFSNVYLNGLDQYVKHSLKCRYYMRYVDDLVLVHESRRQLETWEREIARFLEQELSLALNPASRVLQPVGNGIDFLGYVTRPTYRLCRRRVVNNLKSKLMDFEKKLIRRTGGWQVVRFPPRDLDALFACIQSYLGHFRHANTFRLRQRFFQRNRFLEHFFAFQPETAKLVRKYALPRKVGRMIRQYTYFRGAYFQTLLFFQVGCFMECYGDHAKLAMSHLGLKSIAGKHGYLHRCGFGINALPRMLNRCRQERLAVTVVRQTGRMHGRLAERRADLLLLPV